MSHLLIFGKPMDLPNRLRNYSFWGLWEPMSQCKEVATGCSACKLSTNCLDVEVSDIQCFHIFCNSLQIHLPSCAPHLHIAMTYGYFAIWASAICSFFAFRLRVGCSLVSSPVTISYSFSMFHQTWDILGLSQVFETANLAFCWTWPLGITLFQQNLRHLAPTPLVSRHNSWRSSTTSTASLSKLLDC